MKRLYSIVIGLLILCTSSLALAAGPSLTTYRRTGDGVAKRNACYLTKLKCLISTAETNDYTITLYDNAAAAAGRIIAQWDVDVSEETTNLKAEMFQDLNCRNGIYVDVTQAAGNVYWWVEYRRR